jgi:U32 family peptidase
MKVTTYAQTYHDLNLIKDQGLQEVILGHQDYARFGKLNNQDYLNLAQRARELELRVIFEWDILMTENTFIKLSEKIVPLIEMCHAIRVQDPGALEWAKKNTNRPLQFIAENGNHNLPALQGWIEHVGDRMERIILSIELPGNIIEEYVQKLTVPCELMGFGRILLFYSPRSLLSPLLSEQHHYNHQLTAIGESEESPHKGFPIIENKHGTFMFHIKEFCLLDFAQELNKMGLAYLRVDLRWSDFSLIKDINSIVSLSPEGLFDVFKSNYPQDLMRGFYLVNKTDVLFPKLKNHRLQKREGDYVGEVIEAEKGSHLAIQIKNMNGLRRDDLLKIVHPKGKEFEVKIHSLKDLTLTEVDYIAPQKTALIPFVGGVWVKSLVYHLH